MKSLNVKKICKIITILMLIATIAMSVSMILGTVVYADGNGGSMPMPNIGGNNVPSAVKNATNVILNIIAYVCYATAVVMLIFLGLRYMSKDGSGDKAKVKEQSVIYAVGAILVFGAGTILKIIANANIGDSLGGTTTGG